MRSAYRLLLVILTALLVCSFGPWLLSLCLPEGQKDPFVAYSPLTDSLVLSDDTTLTTADRERLLPHVYFNQLTSRGEMPDYIGPDSVSIPLLKQAQWTFSSLPRDVAKPQPGVHLIMESMPAGYGLNDPDEAFRFTADGVEFIDIKTNTINFDRSRRFSKVIAEKDMKLPVRHLFANITTRKPYDEGYLIVDAAGSVFQMKMQGGRPYLKKMANPDGAEFSYAFTTENTDRTLLGLAFSKDGSLYAVDRATSSLIRLPVEDIYPERDRIQIHRTLPNWVIKSHTPEATVWTVIDSHDYSRLADYRVARSATAAQKISAWLFPFRLTFTSLDDSFARPRFSDFSAKALVVWTIIFIFVRILYIRKR